ncbi:MULTISPECIES: putative molybdenum carrier protein [unclassified Ruegeria]|uniref:putative molybdenum carrier protein n=1 Tax=unclassified Ruegeria TaxID=2625375 RepID=UPI001492E7E1|nr:MULTISPECIES: putative molybdenum carrier protein [unclassified Ruegeria]NOD48712.1 molybdenum cofactor carrier [Ruegeria sp. HKCCD5849]NOD51986.1 molybdenum cofactor carrier [Ruegeria sp. HKCCD5851]NOD66644.1 molybdenum cofactor carrier [Ruegeria sp. HKCCD7303]
MKIISGGQTGVDLAALEFAMQLGLIYGGWIPKGRTNEAGGIPEHYSGLVEAFSSEPDVRTRLNVSSSDATLIITDGSESPGTNYTQQVALESAKPLMLVNLSGGTQSQIEQVQRWIASNKPLALNIAGPRESEAPGINVKALTFLIEVLPWPDCET